MKNGAENYLIARALEYSSNFHYPPKALYYRDPATMTPDQLCVIGAGTDDATELFSDGDEIYVYTANENLEYMSLEVWNIPDHEMSGDVFLDGESYRELERLNPMNRTKAMLQIIGELDG